MDDQKASALDPIGSIDRATDKVYLIDVSAGTSNANTINSMLGITGVPLGVSDAQSPTNKTFDNSNVFTVRSDRLLLQDNADTTKQANFQLSSISAAMTRTFTLPNRSGTLVTLNGNQTFTGVITATGASLNQATITNPALTTDAINEFTPNTGVNIDGLVVKDGLLPAGNIQPLNLVSGTGASWVGQSWVPVFVNLSGGTLNYAKYIQIGKYVFFRWKYTLTGANISGNVSFSTPTTINSDMVSGTEAISGTANFQDTGTAAYFGSMLWANSTNIYLNVIAVGGTYGQVGALSSTVPHTWAATDVIQVSGFYEAA